MSATKFRGGDYWKSEEGMKNSNIAKNWWDIEECVNLVDTAGHGPSESTENKLLTWVSDKKPFQTQDSV